MARKLRIAVSVFFGVLTVALCVMWVRSFWRYEYISRHVTLGSQGPYTSIACSSNHGYLTIYQADWPIASGYAGQTSQAKIVQWTMGSTAANGRVPKKWLQSNPLFVNVNLPYSCIAAATLIGSVMPYIGIRRFSLRTLLIAMTLVAVGLGAIVWLR